MTIKAMICIHPWMHIVTTLVMFMLAKPLSEYTQNFTAARDLKAMLAERVLPRFHSAQLPEMLVA